MHMHTCIYISPQLVLVRLCNGAAASLPWKLLRTYLDRAGCRFRPPSCPFVKPAAFLLARNQTYLLKKSDQIHAIS